ncbi:MAG: hypothetical protein ACKO6A_07785 [Bacteroidota bacterium]
MKKKSLLIFSFLLFLISCNETVEKKPISVTKSKKSSKKTGNPAIDLWADVKQAEQLVYEKKKSGKININYYKSYFDCLLAFYQKLPNDSRADSCLMAICVTETDYPLGHKKHFNLQEEYGDTLLKKYPKSKFRIFVLQDLIFKYDQAINNKRNIKKIKSYYEMWSNSLPNTPEGQKQKKEIQERLKNIDKPIQFKN